MSADLYLIAVPDDPDWQAKYAFMRGADMIGGDVEDAGPDGLIHEDAGPYHFTSIPHETHRALEEELGIYRRPNCWIGQVSWLKAGFGDDLFDRYVPAPVLRVHTLVGLGRRLTPGLAGDILAAMNLPNRSIYGRTHYDLLPPRIAAEYREAQRRDKDRHVRFIEPNILRQRTRGLEKRQVVKRWLAEHQGAWVVQESW